VMAKMSDIQPTKELKGNYRVFTWTFPDKSVIRMYFVPGSPGTGLKLDHVDISE